MQVNNEIITSLANRLWIDVNKGYSSSSVAIGCIGDITFRLEALSEQEQMEIYGDIDLLDEHICIKE